MSISPPVGRKVQKPVMEALKGNKIHDIFGGANIQWCAATLQSSSLQLTRVVLVVLAS
jgi:hypothetical protein